MLSRLFNQLNIVILISLILVCYAIVFFYIYKKKVYRIDTKWAGEWQIKKANLEILLIKLRRSYKALRFIWIIWSIAVCFILLGLIAVSLLHFYGIITDNNLKIFMNYLTALIAGLSIVFCIRIVLKIIKLQIVKVEHISDVLKTNE